MRWLVYFKCTFIINNFSEQNFTLNWDKFANRNDVINCSMYNLSTVGHSR